MFWVKCVEGKTVATYDESGLVEERTSVRRHGADAREWRCIIIVVAVGVVVAASVVGGDREELAWAGGAASGGGGAGDGARGGSQWRARACEGDGRPRNERARARAAGRACC